MRLGAATTRPRRTATLIMVSKQRHCLNDLLFRWRPATLQIEVAGVVSNHRDPEPLVDVLRRAVPPRPGDRRRPRPRPRRSSARWSSELDVDLVVLARYMQVLSDDLCRRLAGRAINIHHSFLPSFKGAKPYHQALRARGEADRRHRPLRHRRPRRGPDHRAGRRARRPRAQPRTSWSRAGRDVEAQVLARAVRWHVEHRVLLNGDRTVVFR